MVDIRANVIKDFYVRNLLMFIISNRIYPRRTFQSWS